MFFSIGDHKDLRFPNHCQRNSLWFNFDNGWEQISESCWYKGYEQNFCQITIDKSGADIKHSNPRSFPLWHNQKNVTNLPGSDLEQQAWADDTVIIDEHGTVITQKCLLDLQVPDTIISLSQAQNQIKNILDSMVTNFYSNHNVNLKLFVSGGLDTMLIYALLKSHQKKFQILDHAHYEHDFFVDRNKSSLDTLWAYKQIHHWVDHSWLATGSHGDEYFLRGPTAIALLTAWHDIDFERLLQAHTQCYHYKYFCKERNLKIFQQHWQQRKHLQTQYPTRQKLNSEILNILVNDHQHWHLGNTMTWTLLKNIQLVQILLQCDIESLLPQFLNGQLTKNLIAEYDPAVLNFVSDYKNCNSQQYLDKFVSWHYQI